MQNIPINQIITGNNYRKTFNDKSLKELAQSIKTNGVLQPILVRAVGNQYQVVAGERRLRASTLLGKVTIPAIVKELTDVKFIELQLIENLQREGVPYIEEAEGINDLRSAVDYEDKELGRAIGKTEWYVSHMIKLANLPEELKQILRNGEINKSVAFQIVRLKDLEQQTKAINDLRRNKKDKLISDRTARLYIADNFGETRKIKTSRVKKTFGNDYQSNWKSYLLTFSLDEFEGFKGIVKKRTETTIWAEAVEQIMLERKQNEQG